MTRKKYILIAVTVLTLMAACFALTGCAHAKDDAGNPADENEQADVAQPITTILFASDYQEEPGFDSPSETFAGIISAIKADGKHPENVVICGDYTNNLKLCDHQLAPDESIEELRQVVYGNLPDVIPDDMIFVQGNHDKMTDALSQSGLHEYNDYLIYVVNTESDFPWKQGKKGDSRQRVEKTASDMKTCFDQLISAGETRPVFIAGHVPLHFTARTSSIHKNGDNLWAGLIFDEVNEAAKSLDIVYMTAHNHSKGWDCYMGGSSIFAEAGQTILIPDAKLGDKMTNKYREETLNFTYMNAGYLGYYANCSIDEVKAGKVDKYEAADGTLTGTLVEIYEDQIVLTRYDADGVHPIGGVGAANPYKHDEKLISSDHYSQGTKSPYIVTRRDTLQ